MDYATAKKTAVYWEGYEAMKEKIASMGWESARDEYNIAVPPGRIWSGSVQGLEYAYGEFAALFETMPA